MKNMMLNLLLLCMHIRNVFLIFFLLLVGSRSEAIAQDKFHYDEFLKKEPYFARHNAKAADSLFLQDIRILNHFLELDSIDAELLKPSILGALMIEQSRGGKPATFKTLIDYLKNFKTSISYQDFRKGVVLYKKLEGKKVDLNNWDTDKRLFVILGFTESDLEDLRNYITERADQNMTYKQAYVGYMKEIEAL